MKFLVSAVLLFVTLSIFAQKKELFLDGKFRPTEEKPTYFATLEPKDGGWLREVYYIPKGTSAVRGLYKDEECTIANGEMVWFNREGKVTMINNYKDGKLNGISYKFRNNGTMIDSINYKDGRKLGVSLGWDDEGYQVDSSYFDGAGNGTEVHWYANGSVSSTGRWTADTIRIKRWTYYHRNGTIMAKQDYDNGKVVNCDCFTENGDALDKELCVEKEAYFPGEEAAWRKFLSAKLDPNVPIRKKAPAGEYTVYVQFVVNKEGKVTDIKALTDLGFGMEAEAIRVIKASPKWVPAFQFGRHLNAYRKQPVTFAITDDRD